MTTAISVKNLSKTYDNGFQALKNVSLDVRKGEILALLGPNGAGKTTLISAICGIINATEGSIEIMGYDHKKQYRQARKCIGLVPQEVSLTVFDKVWDLVTFSRGLFGKPANKTYIEDLLKRLSLWDKKDNQTRMLSGGMKRRVMIAKALAHEPAILFLDEPTAGVDVELRKSMWEQVRELQNSGVTIILTTHYLEEAEEMADRIGVIREGELIVTEDKKTLIKKLGQKELVVDLEKPLKKIPKKLEKFDVQLSENGEQIKYVYDPAKKSTGVISVLDTLKDANIVCKDIQTRQSSLEDIFIQLVDKS